MCIDLTARMETSTCVADAANWGNIELDGTKPTYRPTPAASSQSLWLKPVKALSATRLCALDAHRLTQEREKTKIILHHDISKDLVM